MLCPARRPRNTREPQRAATGRARSPLSLCAPLLSFRAQRLRGHFARFPQPPGPTALATSVSEAPPPPPPPARRSMHACSRMRLSHRRRPGSAPG